MSILSSQISPPYDRCSKSLITIHLSLVLGSPGPDTDLQMCLTRAEQGTRIISLDLLATPFLMQLRKAVGLFLRLTDSMSPTQLSG